jgi:uncharacterized protein GlcG (DUF336 family)
MCGRAPVAPPESIVGGRNDHGARLHSAAAPTKGWRERRPRGSMRWPSSSTMEARKLPEQHRGAKPCITLDLARALVASARAHGQGLRLPPLTVAVLDAGGHLITLDRDDGASILRPKMAIGKAFAALALGGPSRQAADLSRERPVFVTALAQMSETFTPSAGGLLVGSQDRGTLGAIGVTGATPDEDEACALHALQQCLAKDGAAAIQIGNLSGAGAGGGPSPRSTEV